MLQRLTARAVPKPEWGSTQLEPWFPNSTEKIGEMWFEGPADSPLLIKFLFTTAALSVQVHPNDTYAQEHHQSLGKTEMWHILAAEPGAKIAAGFREAVSPEQMRAAVESGEIEQLLAWHDARPGDTFFIPAGTVHAIGGGLTLCEIQQTSDVTYRLYDYGRPRELHLEHGANVSSLTPAEVRSASREGVLVTCPYFTTTRIAGDCAIAPHAQNQSVIVIEGSGTVGDEAARAGDVFLLPAGESTDVRGDLTLLVTHP